MVSFPRSWVEVNLPALAYNIKLVRTKLKNSKTRVALVVKADAYGHGIVQIARYALNNGVDWCAVATVSEGIELRENGITSPVLVMSPILPDEIQQSVFYDLRVMIEDTTMLPLLNNVAKQLGRNSIVHLKVDTGLSRFGCLPEDALTILKEVVNYPNIFVEGIASHFIDSSYNQELSNRQIESFQKVVDECKQTEFLPDIIHMSNTAAIENIPESEYNLVRVGAAAYGIQPCSMLDGMLKPVMEWKTRVLSVRRRPIDTYVSYSATYQTRRETMIATVGVGYGDGYPRVLSNKGHVYINGYKAPIIGMVCMDQLFIDVTDIPDVQVGDVVELIGGHVRSEDLCKLAGMNPREMPILITPRVKRKYIYKDISDRSVMKIQENPKEFVK